MPGRPALLLLALAAACKQIPADEVGQRFLHLAVRSKIGTLDPVQSGMQYTSMALAPVYQSLLRYTYLKTPYTLEPELLADLPTASPDGLTYAFRLRPGVVFHDDPCFPGGRGRTVTAADVLYSIKRMADRDLKPRGWWIYQDHIVGLDEFKRLADARPPGAPFLPDRPVAGLRATGELTFEIELVRPFPQLLHVLAMPYASVVPRECAERYGPEFAQHPVGTGPFRLARMQSELELTYLRHPGYFDDRYPDAARTGLPETHPLLARAGERVPFLDGIVLHVYEQDQPMWLKWRVGDLDVIQVPAEVQPVLLDESGALREDFRAAGVGNYNLPLLDFVYRGFNLEDPIVGGFGSGKKLRQAISLAIDSDELNDAFYAGRNVVYDGPIPPGLDGHPAGRISPYRGKDLSRAKALLAEAGYPDGVGLPPLELHSTAAGAGAEQAEMIARQLKAIGVRLEIALHGFPELNERLKRRKAQMFSLAWGSDYPDAENNLALFYGPNSSPGANNFNYRNPEYDALYEAARVLPPGPERTRLYERLRDLVIEDCPAVGGMARTRFYAWNRRVAPFVPAEVGYRWLMYLDVTPRGQKG